MKTLKHFVALLSALCMTAAMAADIGARVTLRLPRFGATIAPAPTALPAAPRTLVLYDAPPGQTFTKLGMAYAIMMRNLLGHFDSTVDLVPVQNYAAGQVNNYDATF